MADQAQAELYLRLRAAGIGEASRELKGLAAAAVGAGREFRVLSEEAGAGLYRKISGEARQATAELTRMQRVAREGRAAVLFGDMTAGLQGVGRTGAAVFAGLAGGVGSFVTAGVQGTAESLNLHRALQQINYDVASIFTPQIHRAIDAVQRLSDYLRGLTGQQQASAREWVAGALALSGFLALLPRVTGGLAALTRARGAAGGVAATAAAAGGGLPGLGALPLVGGLAARLGSVGLFAALAASSEEGRKALSELAVASAPLVKGFTALVPLLAGAAEGAAKFVRWALHLPGGPEGGVSVAGAAGLGVLGGGLLGALKFGAAGSTVLGMGLTGAALGGPILAALAGISNARADRIENQTDVAELKRRLAGAEASLRGDRLLPFQRDWVEAERDRLRARVREVEAGKPKEALTPFAPGFEGPADLYRRIAEVASADTSKSAAEQTADNTKQMADALRAIREAMAKLGLNAPLDRPGDD